MPFFLRLAVKHPAGGWKRFAVAAIVALGVSAPARAGLAFSLTPAAGSGLGTNEVFFTTALTNLCQTNLYLNGIQICFTNEATNYLTPDTNDFYANVPGILPTDGTYTGAVFGVGISLATPPGIYAGGAALLGGTNIFATNVLACQAFEISLPAAALGVAAGGTNYLLFWPSPPGGFVLQQTPGITVPNWTTAPYASVYSNGLNRVVFPPSAGSQFYRLEYP